MKDILAESEGVRIERIVSHGQITPADTWYDQKESEFVLVLEGKAKLIFENGEESELFKGDYLVIPPHVKHRVSWTDPDADTVWLCVYF